MRHPDFDLLMLAERRRDELAEAAQNRLLKETQGPRGAPRRTNGGSLFHLRETLMLSFAHFLSGIGERLLNWSCRLETRIKLLSEGIAEQPSSPCV